MLITNNKNFNLWLFTEVSLLEVSLLGFIIFAIGFFGIVFTRKNILVLLMSVELMLLGVSFLFIGISTFSESPDGFIFAIVILLVAAAEAAVGLAILVTYNRLTRSILLEEINCLRG